MDLPALLIIEIAGRRIVIHLDDSDRERDVVVTMNGRTCTNTLAGFLNSVLPPEEKE